MREAYGHHGSRATARNENLLSITRVLLQSVLHHVSNTVAVAASIMRQSRLGRNIPATTLIRRLGINDNKPMLVGEFGVGRAGVIGVSGAGAVVDRDDDGGLVGEGVRDIDVHFCLGIGLLVFRVFSVHVSGLE